MSVFISAAPSTQVVNELSSILLLRYGTRNCLFPVTISTSGRRHQSLEVLVKQLSNTHYNYCSATVS